MLSAKADATLTTTMTIAQAAAAYDVIKQEGTSVAFYAGIRYWDVTSELDLKIADLFDEVLLDDVFGRQFRTAHANAGGCAARSFLPQEVQLRRQRRLR